MRGYPKHLNTKEDYLYVHDNFPKEQWAPDFQALLDSYRDWITTGIVADEASGVTDATHRVIKERDQENPEVVTYLQQELKEIPTAKIFRLGFTVEEVQALLA